MDLDDDRLATLMRLAQQGNESAYREVLSAATVFLTRYYGSRVSASAVDDLVQETLMSVHTKRATYDPDRPFLPWLATIARYRLIDQVRRSSRSDALQQRLALHHPSGTQAGLDDAVADRAAVAHLLAQLPTKQADAITAVRLEGRSIAEAARRSGDSETVIKVRIHRGIKRLAQLLERSDAEMPPSRPSIQGPR